MKNPWSFALSQNWAHLTTLLKVSEIHQLKDSSFLLSPFTLRGSKFSNNPISFFILTFFSSHTHTHKCSFDHPFVSLLYKCICSIPQANRLEASYLRQEYVIMAFTRSLHCHRLKWLWLKRISNHFFLLHFFFFVSACHWISCPIYCSRTLKIQGEVSFNLIGDCFFFHLPVADSLVCHRSMIRLAARHLGVRVCNSVSMQVCVWVCAQVS